jgi:site-specific recombinase XerD
MNPMELVLACMADAHTLSRNTRTCYKSHIRACLRWLGKDAELAQMTPANILAYIHSMEADQADGRKHAGAQSIRSHFAALAYFCRWLVETGHLSANPMPDRKAARLPRLKPPIRHSASFGMIAAMLKACDGMAPFARTRARCILFLLNSTAIRRQELLDLRINDVNPQEGYLRVLHGKGDRARTLYPASDALGAVAEWLAIRPKASHDYLFTLGGTARRMGEDGLYHLLKDLALRAGIGDYRDVLPHAMRRGTATRLLQSGYDMRAVQEVLGHSSLVVTSIYLAAGPGRLKELAHLSSLSEGGPPPPMKPAPAASIALPSAFPAPQEPLPAPDVQSTARKASKAQRVPLWQQKGLLRDVARAQKGGSNENHRSG